MPNPHHLEQHLEDLPDWRMPPAELGGSVSSVDTPALLVDLNAFEANMAQVHRLAKDSGGAVRSHATAHKSVDIALMQIAAGAIGVCCQKASEAQVFVQAGIKNVLISNEIYGASKADRVARLAKHAKVAICVDALVQVDQLANPASKHKACIEIYIEIDLGHGRCGVTDAHSALQLARAIASHSPQLKLAGLHAYRGSAQHVRDPSERKNAFDQAVEKLKAIIALLESNGHKIITVTGGGTGTYELEAGSGVYTEVQPGSYVLMDADYALNKPDANMPALQHALFGLCTVMSVCQTHAVLDGGLKAFAVDSGLPKMVLPGWTVKSMSDEHMVITADPGVEPLQIGDKVRLIPGHCDPTVNLHDWLIATRGQVVEQIWPVSARGALF